MPEFARAMRAVFEMHGPARAVIAHSMGGSATALAASWGVPVGRLVFLGAPTDPAAFVAPFATALGLRDEVVAAMRTRSERRIRFRWSGLDVLALAPHRAEPLLVVHDRDDETVPFVNGVAIAAAWPGARFVATRGLGHRGLVRDPAVVAEVVRFVSEAGEGRDVRVAAGEDAQLEHELYYRDRRRHAPLVLRREGCLVAPSPGSGG